MSVIWLTTGLPGAGKTYSRVVWLVTDYLVNSTGTYITNLPLNVDAICQFVSNRTGKPADSFRDRLILIPSDEFTFWTTLENTPSDVARVWESDPNSFPPRRFFNAHDLTNAHIAIDEFHLVLSKGAKPKLRQAWSAWFAEIRKSGCTFEGITQDMDLIAKEFLGKVALRIDLVPASDTRDPVFKVLMGDWYELRSAYTGIVQQTTIQFEYTKKTSLTGGLRWHLSKTRRYILSSDFYSLYDSYKRNDTGESGKSSTPSQIWGKRTIFWFLRRNGLSIFFRLIIFLGLFWLLFGGGAGYVFKSFIETSVVSASSNFNSVMPSSSEVESKKVSRDAPHCLQAPSVQGQNELSDSSVSDPNSVPVVESPVLVPVLFFEDSCFLKTGEHLKVGYVFTHGYFKGLTVEKVSMSERLVRLSDGSCYYMSY